MSTRKKNTSSRLLSISHEEEERKSAIQAWKKDSIACCCLFASHSQISPKLSHGRLFCSTTPLPACLLERQNIEFHQTNLKITREKNMTCGMHFSSCCSACYKVRLSQGNWHWKFSHTLIQSLDLVTRNFTCKGHWQKEWHLNLPLKANDLSLSAEIFTEKVNLEKDGNKSILLYWKQ